MQKRVCEGADICKVDTFYSSLLEKLFRLISRARHSTAVSHVVALNELYYSTVEKWWASVASANITNSLYFEINKCQV